MIKKKRYVKTENKKNLELGVESVENVFQKYKCNMLNYVSRIENTTIKKLTILINQEDIENQEDLSEDFYVGPKWVYKQTWFLTDVINKNP